MKSKIKLLVICMFTVFLAISCTKRKPLDKKNSMVINLEAEPPTLDWTKSSDTTSSQVIDNIMDGLTDYDIKDPEMKTIPKIAESWKITKGGTVYTFKLRKDIKWHDGVPLTAQHVYDGWKRLIEGETGSPYAYFIYDVKNARNFNAGKAKIEDVGIKVIDDYTFEVTLDQPAAYFINIPTHSSTFPVRLDLIKKHGDAWTEAGNLVGMGPYKLKDWIHDSQLTLERNDAYYGPLAKIKTISCRIIPELSSAITLFETGKVDVIFPKVPSLELPRLRKTFPNQLKENNQLGSFYIGFNIRKKPFDNPIVRKAISMAIDRTEITKIKKGGEIPFSSWIPKGMMGYNPNQGVKFDPIAAKALLKKAGYDTPDKLPVIKLLYNTNEDHKPVMENLQAQLARNLGIKVSIENQEWKTYIDKLKNLKKIKNHENNPDSPNMYRMGWIGDYPDPDNFMNLFTSYSANNYTGWKNLKYDKLIKKAQSELNIDVRRKLYNEAQSLLTEIDIPIMPLYVYSQQMLIKPHLKGYQQNPLQKFYLDQFYIE